MAQPAAKRLKGSHSAAPPASIERRAVLDCQLAPLRDKERELKAAEAELHRRQAELQRQIAPLQREREAVSGYLQLLGPSYSWSQPSYPEWAADIDFPSEPSILYAAQQRLAIAGIGSSRLGAACTLSSDIAEMVAFHIRGFDHEAEMERLEEDGVHAARAQFRPQTLPAAGEKPEATGFLIEGCPDGRDAECEESYPFLNDVYRLDEELFEGWPVLTNNWGYCCSQRSRSSAPWGDEWHLSCSFEGNRLAHIDDPAGPLPVGATTWNFRTSDGEWEPEFDDERTVTVTLLRTEAEVEAAEQRIIQRMHREALAATEAARAGGS